MTSTSPGPTSSSACRTAPKSGGSQQCGHRAPEQARLPARRPERADGRVDLADVAAEIDRDGDRHRAPAVDLGRREIEAGAVWIVTGIGRSF